MPPRLRLTPVHPRVRGEQAVGAVCCAAGIGSSPRARGAAVLQPEMVGLARFIPACAGSRVVEHQTKRLRAVHPRVRGEQDPGAMILPFLSGSSPRARGAGQIAIFLLECSRFIPACAGSSSADPAESSPIPVHPRVRGEQAVYLARHRQPDGSSPRARGAGFHDDSPSRRFRFIPACAGSRNSPASSSSLISVHPRVRGEQAWPLAIAAS